MRDDLIVPGEGSEHAAMAVGNRVIVEPFSPLLDRLKKEKPELAIEFEALRTLIGVDDFEKYFNNLQSIKKADETVMLITDREMNRTAIERQFLGAIRDTFAVKYVRVVCQPIF